MPWQNSRELTHTRPWLLVAKAWAAFSSQFADAIIAIQTLEQLLNQNNHATENMDQLWGSSLLKECKPVSRETRHSPSHSWKSVARQVNSWLRSLIPSTWVSRTLLPTITAAKRLLRSQSHWQGIEVR